MISGIIDIKAKLTCIRFLDEKQESKLIIDRITFLNTKKTRPYCPCLKLAQAIEVLILFIPQRFKNNYIVVDHE